MNKAVFLDRDGTLIVDKIYLNDPQAIEYREGVFEGLRRLSAAGYLLVIVTNQSGVPRGLVSLANLEQIHQIIGRDCEKNKSPIAGFYYAPYLVESDHPMRKPNPGMLQAGAEDLAIDLKQSWMVGDKFSDVVAGRRAGAKSILVPDDRGVMDPSSQDDSNFIRARDFNDAVNHILK